MFAFTMAQTFQLLIYSWNGNEVTLESLKISDAIYDIKWFGSDKNVKIGLILVMIRAQRPCVFTAAKFTNISIETFVKVSFWVRERL